MCIQKCVNKTDVRNMGYMIDNPIVVIDETEYGKLIYLITSNYIKMVRLILTIFIWLKLISYFYKKKSIQIYLPFND